MVLPPIVVAIIWKVIYTPDISPMHGLFRALGWNVPALITDPNWALTSIIIADTWEWFPFTMLMVLAALQMMPQELLDAAKVDGATQKAKKRCCCLAIRPSFAGEVSAKRTGGSSATRPTLMTPPSPKDGATSQ